MQVELYQFYGLGNIAYVVSDGKKYTSSSRTKEQAIKYYFIVGLIYSSISGDPILKKLDGEFERITQENPELFL